MAVLAALVEGLPVVSFRLDEPHPVSVPLFALGGLLLLAAPEQEGRRAWPVGLVGTAIALFAASEAVGALTFAGRWLAFWASLAGLAGLGLGLARLVCSWVPSAYPWVLVPATVAWIVYLLVDPLLADALGVWPPEVFVPAGENLLSIAWSASLVPLVVLWGLLSTGEDPGSERRSPPPTGDEGPQKVARWRPAGSSASSFAGSGLALLTVGGVAALVRWVPSEAQFLVDPGWLAWPAAIVGGALLWRAPENRERRGLLAGLAVLGGLLYVFGFFVIVQTIGTPRSTGLEALAESSIGLWFALGQTCWLAAVGLALVPLSRRHVPRASPWILVPAAVLWSMVPLVDQLLVGVFDVVLYETYYPTGDAFIRTALAAGLVPLVTVAGAIADERAP